MTLIQIQGIITKEIKHTKTTFKMMENVQQFTKACTSLGIRNVFLPGELVNKTDLMAVVATIHALADYV